MLTANCPPLPSSQAGSRRRPTLRATGFTLIELLVVIAIIAILVALLLPAVQQVREAARKSQCQDHLHNLAIAAMNYEGTYQMIPPGMTGNNDGAVHNSGRLSCFFGMLPYIEQKPLFDQIRGAEGQGNQPWQNLAWWNATIPVLQCPSDTPQVRDRGKNSYVGNRGDRATELEHREPERNRGAFGGWTPFRIAEFTDGVSNTIAFSEIRSSKSYGSDMWESQGVPKALVAGVGMNPSLCLAALDPTNKNRWATVNAPTNTYRRGDRWGDGRPVYTGFQTILPPNSPSCVGVGNTEEANDTVLSASSMHPGGVHIVLLDGKVSFISENVDAGNSANTPPGRTTERSPYGVWGALGTRNGSETARVP